MSRPLVSAIVLNYRTPKIAWLCVEALLRQTIVEDIEILVVDNHSDDDSIGYLRNRARGKDRVRILETHENIGYGRGNGIAIKQANGEFLCIINPDNILEDTGLERMVQAMQQDPAIGILAPRLMHNDGTARDSSRAFPSLFDVLVKRTMLRRLFPERLGRYLQQKEDRAKVRDVDWVVGACMLIRKETFLTVGGFDPRFFLFFEDTDLCRRFKQAGHRVVYFPSVTALDRKKRLSDGGFWSLFTKKTARIHLASALRYFWKWRS